MSHTHSGKHSLSDGEKMGDPFQSHLNHFWALKDRLSKVCDSSCQIYQDNQRSERVFECGH